MSRERNILPDDAVANGMGNLFSPFRVARANARNTTLALLGEFVNLHRIGRITAAALKCSRDHSRVEDVARLLTGEGHIVARPGLRRPTASADIFPDFFEGGPPRRSRPEIQRASSCRLRFVALTNT